MEPLLPLSRASIFFDGTIHEPQLNHPEDLAVAADGAIWCGGTGGEIYRVSPDGSELEQVASTGGLVLGLAFDRDGFLYACDIKRGAVLRLDPRDGSVETFAKPTAHGGMKVPNYAVVDPGRGCLYVSDSNAKYAPGMGVWRFDLEGGDGDLWWDRPMNFANGMALSPDGDTLFVAESFGRLVTAIRIEADGAPGPAETVIENLDGVLDGLAVAADGTLYLAYFTPSKITRLGPGGTEELLLHDPDSSTLCQPTNIAWRGNDLFATNLGAFHITKVDLDVQGHAVP